jgi:hypothetical protein
MTLETLEMRIALGYSDLLNSCGLYNDPIESTNKIKKETETYDKNKFYYSMCNLIKYIYDFRHEIGELKKMYIYGETNDVIDYIIKQTNGGLYEAIKNKTHAEIYKLINDKLDEISNSY